MANEKLLIDANATLAGIEAFMQCYVEKEKELTPFLVKVATQGLDMVRRFIKEMPTVDAVEVVHGRWEPVYSYDDGEIDHIAESCSVCKGHVSWFKGLPFNYCPNCGAKMDGDGNGN